MIRFSRFILLGLVTLFCGISASNAYADVFATVPVDSILYTQLDALQQASWQNDISSKTPRLSKSTELTRYEFTVEIAKSAIDFTAHSQASPDWIATVPRAELRSLRALLLEFSIELVRFNVKTENITNSIDEVLRNSASSLVRASSPKAQPEKENPFALGGFSPGNSLNLLNQQPATTLSMPLSRQLELYAQMTAPTKSLLRVVPSSMASISPSDVEAEANTALSAGANMNINDWLSLRAGYAFQQHNQPHSLQQILLSSNNNSWFTTLGSTDSIGGGLDVRVSPALMLSGGISRLSLNAANGFQDFSGTQLEGGVGVSGLNNRLLLSARLARLMPDDAASLASTAARLNLDFAISNSLSFNLLYQQMFSLSPQQNGKSTFAGGVNIHF